ncbi:MAG: NERD domain-containing protein [Bacteroidales bacterium]|nr:NERD domain-containing protein [Bacteroidales bacterium]
MVILLLLIFFTIVLFLRIISRSNKVLKNKKKKTTYSSYAKTLGEISEKSVTKKTTCSSYAKVLGEIGEESVASILRTLPKDYVVFNDVYLEIKGKSTQIDHVVISRYGVFIIETKNYTGWIFGNDTSEYWTQTIYEDKYKLRNPLRQNYSHLKTLQSIFGIEERFYFPIVAFHDRATLKCETNGNVMYFSELKDFILSKHIQRLSDELVNRLSAILMYYSVKNENQKQEHILKVKQDIANKESLVEKGICPKCGGMLIHRQGKYGEFISCINYPSCRFTQNINR